MRIRRIGAVALAALFATSGACSNDRAARTSAPAVKQRADAAGVASNDDLARALPVVRRVGDRPRVTLLTSPAQPKHADAPAPRNACADANPSGGEWTSLNGDLQNTRSQPDETTLHELDVAWSYKAEANGIPGGMRSTPIVSGGCVYLAFGQGYLGDRGDVVALDADTGALVWHARFDGSVLGLAARNGLIYVTPSKGTRGEGAVKLPVVTEDYQPAGSFAAALDAHTGALAWTSDRLDDGTAGNGTFINASPVVFEAGNRHLVFVPLAGGAGDGARVPMYFLDALTGKTVRRAFSLTDAEYAAGFGGTGIWSTAAYDPVTQHLYAGTADSDGYTRQHPYNNALLKIDANPTRATFAKVVGAYTGTTEHANLDTVIGYPNNPLCTGAATSDVDLPTFFDTSASPECLELDLDFGASPNLVRDATGKLSITALQKSGVFHSVDAATMKPNWTFFVGPGGAAMDSVTAAVDGTSIYAGATPNLLFGLNRATGSARWASTTGVDVFAYQPITVANGVVYTTTDTGMLVGLDAASGLPITQRALALDGGFTQCLGVGSGVAVARHMLFAPCDAGGTVDLAGVPGSPGGVIAYRSKK